MSNPLTSNEIFDKANGAGAHYGTGINKKIGAIKDLRQIIFDVFGPQSDPSGPRHMVGLKQAKEYVEQFVQRAITTKTDAECVIECFFFNADSGWLLQNKLASMGSIRQAVEAFCRHGAIQNYRTTIAPPQKEEPAPAVKMMHGKIIGWRTFRYERQGLHPLSHRTATFNTVGKTIDPAPDPEIDNEFGFWCFKKKSDLQRYLTGWQFGMQRNDSSFLHATILLTGDVIEHETGWRAKEIEILGLYSDLNNSQRRGIAHKLGWYGKVLPTSQGLEEFPYDLKEV